MAAPRRPHDALAALDPPPRPWSLRQRRTALVLEEALYAAGDPMPLTHATRVVGGVHWLRLLAALRCLDDDDTDEAGR